MGLSERQKVVISLLIEHELAINQLYSVYAAKLKEHRNFWQQLADEETKHADVIRRFEKEVEAGKMCLEPERFKQPAIERSLRYIFDICEEADSGKVDMNKALSEAFHIEDAMIEHKFFEVFGGDSDEFKQALKILEEATKKHHQFIKEAMNSLC
jgi:hypothetical protein